RQFPDHRDSVSRGSLARQDYHPADAGRGVTLERVGRRRLLRAETEHYGELNPLGVASILARHPFDLRYTLLGLFVAEAARHPSVRPSRDPFQRRPGIVRAEKNRRIWLLHRLGKKPDRWEPDDLAFVARLGLAPQLTHRLDR